MPRFPMKPITRLSKQQWKELLTRIFEKQRRLPAQAAREIVSGFEPPVEREMGTLFRDIPIGVGEARRTAERLPIAEARAKYFANPQEFVTPTMVEPTAKEMAIREAGPGLAPSELAKTVAYERLRFRPIIPPGVQRAATTLTKEAKTVGDLSKLRQVGLTPEDIRPGMAPMALEERGLTPVAKPEIAEVVQTALVADTLWKEMGGARSMAGKMWNELQKAQTGAVRQRLTSGRDYFVSCFSRWRMDPSKFRSKHPREAKLLDQVWKTFEESLEGIE